MLRMIELVIFVENEATVVPPRSEPGMKGNESQTNATARMNVARVPSSHYLTF